MDIDASTYTVWSTDNEHHITCNFASLPVMRIDCPLDKEMTEMQKSTTIMACMKSRLGCVGPWSTKVNVSLSFCLNSCTKSCKRAGTSDVTTRVGDLSK